MNTKVKHTTSDGVTIEVRCYTQTIVAGRTRSVRSYSGDSVDWLAVYDATTAPVHLPACPGVRRPNPDPRGLRSSRPGTAQGRAPRR